MSDVTPRFLTEDEVAQALGLSLQAFKKSRPFLELKGFPRRDPIIKHWFKEHIDAWLAGYRPETTMEQFRTRKPGFIYFVISGDAVKIGFANDVASRLSGLQIGNPVELTLHRAIPGTFDDEYLLHARFMHLRIRGEWFRWCDEIREAIDAL